MDTKQTMELLAPAGSIEAYEAAVTAGADAVYVGAPAFNARALARHFDIAEIAAMVAHGRATGVKLFVAMNSLLKEDEIPQAVALLASLAELKIDGLIIQDLGIHYLAKKYFPDIRMHASTLMAAHNAPIVRQFDRMGFKRVVLARELTIAEIRQIHAETDVELEVFVHGAMCFSVSGLCLFSSYLGGKSGLRGRCVQPCRRRYTWAGPGRETGGYLFSMHDLSAINLLPQLREAGVSSLKIEGRMRSAQYVGSVVRAYRLMLDGDPADPATLAAAASFLAEAMGRKTTTGFFLSAKPKDIISPQHSGNIGIFLGKIGQCNGNRASFTLRGSLRVGDRVRLHQEKSGERESFTLKKMLINDRSVAEAKAGTKVTAEIPFNAARGDSLYLVDQKERRDLKKGGAERVSARRFQKKIDHGRIKERTSRILADLNPDAINTAKSERKQGERPGPAILGRKRSTLAWWLKVDDLRLLGLKLPVQPERLVVLLRRETFGQAGRMLKELKRRKRTVVWALPALIFPDDLEFYNQAISALLAEGFQTWLISHVGQVALLAELVTSGNAEQTALSGRSEPNRGRGEGRKQHITSMADITLFGNYTLNILNSLSVRVLADLGLSAVELAIESDQESLSRLLTRPGNCRRGLTVYGLPALFTARACPDHFKYDHIFVSPKQERFTLLERGGMSVAVPDEPFSLLAYHNDLIGLGLDFLVIDLTFMQKKKSALAALGSELARPGKQQKGDTFNFRVKLL